MRITTVSSCVTILTLGLLSQFAAAQIGITRCQDVFDTVTNPTPAQVGRGHGAEAVCVLEPTTLDELPAVEDPIAGYFLFVLVAGADASEDFLCVEYDIENIAEGDHGFHVHTYGSLSTDGTATGGHFLGECNECRPNAPETPPGWKSEAGLLNDGEEITVASGDITAAGFFNDESILTFSGVNSVIGRSVVVHEAGGAGRIAQCVIGHNTATDSTANPDPALAVENVPGVTRAIAKLSPSGNGESSGGETGFVRFTQRDPADGLLVEMWLTGFQDCDVAHEFHVHELANIEGDDTTGPHFTGDVAPLTGRPNLGWLGPTDDAKNTGIVSNMAVNDNICAGSWVFSDPLAKLEGPNSIVGRSIVLHDTGTDNTDRISHGVIGILEEGAPSEASDSSTPEETPKVLVARAVLLPTAAEEGSDTSQVHGTVEFSAEDGTNDVVVTYHFTGLTRDEGHGWHVHQWGDISSDDALATGGHFVGTCSDTMCRENAVLQEIGLIGDGHSLEPLNGESFGSFVDDQLRLNGVDSIVGRSVVVHGLGANGGIRVAQGVIGRVVESNEMVPNQPLISKLRCDITPLGNDAGYDAAGYVELSREQVGGDITVTYSITGLSAGEHAWHVHNFGNLLSNQDGGSTDDHFLGDPLPGRPGGLDEVGAINDNTGIMANPDGEATGSFVDNVLQFDGAHSIVGRSIIIHAVGARDREAACVLGIESEFEDASTASTPDPTTDSAASTATCSLAVVFAASMLALLA